MFEELEKFRLVLEEKEKAREDLIKKCRELRILSTKAINAVHKGKIDDAKAILSNAKVLLEDIKKYKNTCPEFYYSITHNSMQEFAEAYVFLSVISGENVKINNIDVEIPALLCGIADFVGEMRRYILDLLRRGKITEANRYIDIIETVYQTLIQFDFPEKILPGFRHKLDMVRAMLERTKADLLTAKAALECKKVSSED